jgi:hypothetical protein
MKRIREVKWPWNEESILGYQVPLTVEGLRKSARFLSVLPFSDGDLAMYFEEEEADTIAKPRHFMIFRPFQRFSADLEGSQYMAATSVHGGRLAILIYEILRLETLGALRNDVQTKLSAERVMRATRGRRS